MKKVTGFDDVITLDEGSDIENIASSKLIDINSYPVKNVINILLQDKTTKKNIIWATDSYCTRNINHKDKNQIQCEDFYTGIPVKLEPRNKKDVESQNQRTRKKAEVFTPLWICNKMNNHLDAEWFGYENVFNKINLDQSWTVVEDDIRFIDGKSWTEYIDSRRLEITCGEAPFIVSRYDALTGKVVSPLKNRIGILDRKLRIVSENTKTLDEWFKWTVRSFQSCYGYEWQGDNLLIARINLLMTFCDYYLDRWGVNPDEKCIKQIANIISWNFWQMDGLKKSIPFGKPYQDQRQLTLFDSFDVPVKEETDVALPCKIYDWRRDNSIQFSKIKKAGIMGKKLFDFVIGNPPYQESSEKNARQPPVYHLFMDSAYEVSNSVELITPARFLFNAGQTPKEWNNKMLNDPHFKVIYYESDGSKIFPSAQIKGGVTITYRDTKKDFGSIVTYIPYEPLQKIFKKITFTEKHFLDEVVSSRGNYRFSDDFYQKYPDAKKAVGEGTGNMIVTNIFDKFPKPFDEEKKTNSVKIIGRKNNARMSLYISREYILQNEYLDTYNLLLAKSNNDGTFGETLSSPIIACPGECATDTFISIGLFKTRNEVENAAKYIKTKFLRALLGIKKVTQDNPKSTWSCIPVQNFSDDSDVDWSRSINEIDFQLYKKYNFTPDEISFIESHVQEMN